MQVMLNSSLSKIFPHKKPACWEKPGLSLLSGERGAFQLVCFSHQEASLKIDISGLPSFCAYRVCNLPSSYPCHPETDEGYLSREPGLYPDLLKPADLSCVQNLPAETWTAFWISLENLPEGTYQARLHVSADTEQEELMLPVSVSPAILPPQTLYHTEWFHGDCLADYYQVPVFSESHWQAIDGFLSSAARCGVNMILTPVFTPPLDTAKGGERTTIQLVDVACCNGHYTFCFQKLRRWISLLQKHGIRELEISHLFTQWGAIAAPKVMVEEDGVLIQKFGWHTQAVGGEYTRFLRCFLPELKKELMSLGVWEHTWFHISDEPSEEQRTDYEAARNSIRDLLPEGRVIDALSSFEFYRRGAVDKPVVCEDHIEPFRQAGVPGLWTYYCTAQNLLVPNRFFSMPSERNRILGVLLYVYDLQGFLHWGFNFYNTQYSLMHIDPYQITDAGGVFPSGDAFLVYPAPDKTAWPSIRSEVLQEGLQDLRLLRLAESQVGRQSVLNLLEELAGGPITFTSYPISQEFFFCLKKRILQLLNP